MRLYNSIGPNPHTVRMFAAEKGVALDLVAVDLMGGENRRPEHLARNPWGQTPALELPDGRHLTEITAVCEYLDEQKPEPVLIGATPEERAVTRMWTRRIDLNICEPLTTAFRFSDGLPLFKDRVRTIPEAADGLKALAREQLAKLDGVMVDGDFVTGEAIRLPDILLYGFLAFGAQVGQGLDPANARLAAWYARMDARPSAKA